MSGGKEGAISGDSRLAHRTSAAFDKCFERYIIIIYCSYMYCFK